MQKSFWWWQCGVRCSRPLSHLLGSRSPPVPLQIQPGVKQVLQTWNASSALLCTHLREGPFRAFALVWQRHCCTWSYMKWLRCMWSHIQCSKCLLFCGCSAKERFRRAFNLLSGYLTGVIVMRWTLSLYLRFSLCDFMCSEVTARPTQSSWWGPFHNCAQRYTEEKKKKIWLWKNATFMQTICYKCIPSNEQLHVHILLFQPRPHVLIKCSCA